MDQDEAARRLRRAEEEARQRVQNLVEAGLDRPLSVSVGGDPTADNEGADLGSETFEREKDMGLYLAARARLEAVEAARRRLADGRFGRCERCGGPIGDARLRALPWAALCLPCQEEVEAASRAVRTARTLGEEIVPMPYGGGRETPGVDGEDVWRALAAHGTANGPQDEAAPEAAGEGGDDGVVEAVDALADPRADTPGQAFPELARRPGGRAYEPEEGEGAGRGGRGA
ncbi:MAG: TraR/DksA family transcriptional regulator [Firmicutes bacterium]|nr:TraR/DksA family transcriptional regulator [Bacillota bacterium]